MTASKTPNRDHSPYRPVHRRLLLIRGSDRRSALPAFQGEFRPLQTLTTALRGIRQWRSVFGIAMISSEMNPDMAHEPSTTATMRDAQQASPRPDDRTDFFISRAGSSAAIAREVADFLIDSGSTVFVQDYDIPQGLNFVTAMHDALKRCRHLIVLLTKDYDASSYTMMEVCNFLADAARPGRERRLVVLRVEECEPQGLFAGVVYADLVGVDDPEQRRARILAAARGEASAQHSSPAISNTASTDGPSIVVLPFTNMSGDPEQEFFVDGLTLDILTELSRFRHLFVISRGSTFKYKGKVVNVRHVARDLGVQYVVEGTVRKASNRVRITVQLIDGPSDRQVWTERYDRQLEDIFAIQDELTAAIVSTLPGRVEAATQERVGRKPTENMVSYECVLAGKLLNLRLTRADNEAALLMFDRAITLDPNYAEAHAWKACTLGQAWVHRFCADREATYNQAINELQTALRLDSNNSDVHRLLAALNLAIGHHDSALFHQQRALSLNPNDDLVVVQQGELLTWLGRPEEGIEWIEKAMRLNPYHPERFWNHLGRAFFVARRYADAISAFQHITAPDQFHHAFLAACHAQLDDDISARQHATEVLKLAQGFCVDIYLQQLHYKRPEDREHHRNALLKSELPRSPASAA